MTEPHLSVVVPVHNEAENILPLYRELQAALSHFVWEVVFVNDGSSDQSLEILKNLALSDSRIKIVSLRQKYGQTSALSAGLKAVSGSFIATLDGDLQNDPADLPRLMQLCDQVDIVSGWRKKRQDQFLRVLVSNLANRLAYRVTGLMIHDYGCSLKVYRREVLKGVHLYGDMHRFLPLYLYRKGARVLEAEVNHRPRLLGVSKYGYQRILRVLVDMCLFYFLFHQAKPLPVFASISAGLFVVAIAGGIFAFYGSAFGFLLAIILYPLSLFLLSSGLIVELILRTHYLSQNEVQYVVAEIFNLKGHPDL